MRRDHRVKNGLFVPYNATTLRREFHSQVRPFLSPAWREKRIKPSCNPVTRKNGEFVLEIKGFRKSYSTTIFWRNWQKFGECTAGILFAQAEMRHSSMEITAQHYLKELDRLEVERWDAFLRSEEHAPTEQTRIVEWLTTNVACPN